MAAEPLTELEAAIETIIDIYHNYAITEEGAPRLSFNAFNKMVTQQLPHFLKGATSPVVGSLTLLACFFTGRSICEDISSFFGILMAAESLTELEAAIDTIMENLHTYALVEDRGFYLSFTVFKDPCSFCSLLFWPPGC
ncbi:uncharacterized protein LOC132647999 isoform X1 [Meriones unguiculatus]|uniref:uncharacterized protein LOC132647999 isoform X1 n=1 Tax=Meriones unguiculatus TaxID=10047 RepID=UPI00293F4FDC|nr:uncharacterized protein LOC132647999 isoform X1 [Meriones unguiculatus]